MRVALDDPDHFSTLDIAFHNVVCGAAANFLLGQFMGIINTLAKVSRERTGASRPVRELALAITGSSWRHCDPRDPDAAADAMRAHLQHVEKALVSPRSRVRSTGPAREPAGVA